MQSRAVVFCCGAIVGLGVSGAAVVLYKGRPEQSPGYMEFDANQHSVFRFGYPQSNTSAHAYSAHSLMYDRAKKIPIWVAEYVNKEMVTSSVAKRRISVFQPDPQLPEEFCSSNADYQRSGWSRGHMAPAGNYKHCQNSMNDTFYLTNIVPQNTDNNSGYWNSIEDYCRRLSKQYQVNVISGPLFLPRTDPNNNKKYVKYEVIGANNVAVPTHLFKIILATDQSDDAPLLGAFIVPNEPVQDVSLTEFQVKLEEVEQHTGAKFHCKLNRSQARNLCVVEGCKIRSQKDFAILSYKHKVRKTENLKELESVWSEINRKGIHHDRTLSDLYAQKKESFSEH